LGRKYYAEKLFMLAEQDKEMEKTFKANGHFKSHLLNKAVECDLNGE
jgi:hypothetical protein